MLSHGLLLVWYTELRSLQGSQNKGPVRYNKGVQLAADSSHLLQPFKPFKQSSSLLYKEPHKRPFPLALKISSLQLIPFPLMGHPSVSYGLVLPKSVVVGILLIDYIQFTFSLLLYYLGLSASSEAPPSPWEDYAFYFQAADLSSSTPSVSVTPSSIKSRLRVVEFSSLSKRSSEACRGEETICAVCMGELEARQEVRELGNCSHGFHVECIDKWVDAGQMTCPLCRSKLLPGKKRKLAWFQRFWWSTNE